MCLGEVGCVRRMIDSQTMSIELNGRSATVSAMLLDVTPEAGQWVLVHSGFALGMLTEIEARAALEMRLTAGGELGRGPA